MRLLTRSQLKGAVAAFAAAASFAAVAAAPASANHMVLPVETSDLVAEPILPECIRDPALPTCVNYAIDILENEIEMVERRYEATVEPYVCDVQWILDGEGCATS